MKQSLRAWKPDLEELLPFEEAIQRTHGNFKPYIAYLGTDDTPLLRERYVRGDSVSVFVGPEGGFSPREAEAVRFIDGEYVSLGPNRLRTETAAIAAVHTIEQLNW